MTHRPICLTIILTLLPLAPAAAQDATAGQRTFQQRCAACHSLEDGENRVGPHLFGVVGRLVASVEGARYSPGLQGLGGAWDEARLTEFLAGPRAMAPGTAMAISVPNEADRANIVAFLAAPPG